RKFEGRNQDRGRNPREVNHFEVKVFASTQITNAPSTLMKFPGQVPGELLFLLIFVGLFAKKFLELCSQVVGAGDLEFGARVVVGLESGQML
ncbi:MAG: hypothetical protein ACKOQX_05985, partial [Actinomycetota bacterium]